MYNPKAHLKRLVEVHAPSGYEAPVAQLLRDEWANDGCALAGLRPKLLVTL